MHSTGMCSTNMAKWLNYWPNMPLVTHNSCFLAYKFMFFYSRSCPRQTLGGCDVAAGGSLKSARGVRAAASGAFEEIALQRQEASARSSIDHLNHQSPKCSHNGYGIGAGGKKKAGHQRKRPSCCHGELSYQFLIGCRRKHPFFLVP